MAAMFIHIPAEVLQVMGKFAALSGEDLSRSAKIQAYGMAQGNGQGLVDLLPAVNGFVTPIDVAVSLVFHNHEIMNLNVEQGTSILNLIQTLPCPEVGDVSCRDDSSSCRPFIITLACMISAKGAATTMGGWATLATPAAVVPARNSHRSVNDNLVGHVYPDPAERFPPDDFELYAKVGDAMN